MSSEISQNQNPMLPKGMDENDIERIQKTMAQFLGEIRQLHAEHEKKIRVLLKEIDERKAEAIKESIKSLYT